MKFFSTAAAVTMVATGIVGLGAQSASAGDCAVLDRTYTSGSSKYAVVRNVCGRGIIAQVVVNNFPDTGCESIGAYGTRTYRTGGILSPTAPYAREC